MPLARGEMLGLEKCQLCFTGVLENQFFKEFLILLYV